MESLSTKHFRFAEFELDGPKRLLLRNGEAVSLNPKALDLLLALVESRGEVLTKDALLDRVWPDQIIEEGNLKVHVSALRKALGQSGNEHRFIVTVPGRGYSFVGDLKTDARGFAPDNDSPIVGDAVTHRAGVTQTDDVLPDAPSPRTPLRLLVGTFLIVASVVLGYWLLTPDPEPSGSIESIAVMPFVNEGGNPELEYLSDGMTESLINSLSGLPKLSVKARSSIFRYKGSEASPKEVGADLNVQAVLIGRFVERGEQFTLYLSLVDVRTGDQVWGDQYTRMIGDLISLQNQIARDVAEKLRLRLSGADEQKLAKTYTENAEAFQLYLRGRFFWNKFTAESQLKSIEYFKQAIAVDPNYALAYVGLADAYGASATNSWIPPAEGYAKAKAAVRKALEIDNGLAQGHANLGAMYMFSDFDWSSAEREYKLAVELDSNYELTHELYSYLLSALGRPDEAIAQAERAVELDPLSATFSDDLALAYFLARRFDEAAKQNLQTLELEPNRPDTIYRLGNIHTQKGSYNDAVAAYNKAMSLSERSSQFLGALGHAHAVAGKKNEAQKVLNEMQELSGEKHVSPYDLAIIYAGLGENEKALELLNEAYDQKSGWIINLRVDPFLDPLRDDPRFQKLIARSGL
jgi:DNA-binding winged helix-turn-helix (wHTH) protein/TolB-like protein/Tfp pilus assembly protein PilF